MEKVIPTKETDLLLLRCLEGDADDREYEKAWTWIHQSDQNLAHYKVLRDAWIASGLIKPVDEQRKKIIWEKLEKKMRPDAKTPNIKIIRLKILKWVAAAAVLVCVYLSGIYTVKSIGEPELSGSGYVIEAPKGGKSFMTLEDGTKVWLNAGSQLSFSRLFNEKERTTSLQGEAYFEVAPDQDKPFLVEVSGITIQALGTAFNIKAYPEDQIIETTLVEGSVRIETNSHSKTKSEPIILEPNQKATYYKSGQLFSVHGVDDMNEDNIEPAMLHSFAKVEILKNVDTEASISWKDKRWMVQGVSLGEFASNIERRYDVEIIFNDKELKNYKISATLEEETIEQLLNAIQLTVPMDYKIIRNRVYLNINMQLKKKYDRLIKYNN